VRTGTARLPYYSAGLVLAVAAAVAGCSGSGSSAAGSGPAGATTAAASPLAAVQLAAKTATSANSYTGTMNLEMTQKPGASGASGSGTLGDVTISAAFAEQLHPSLLASVNIGTLSAGGQSLPGGLSEILTPSTLYMKWSFLTSSLHLSKPWLAIPLSSVSQKSGVNLGQIFSQLQSNGPLTESQLLAGATSVRQVGTGTIDGVTVTEYSGTLPLDKGIGYLSGSVKAQVKQAMAAAGISTAKFTVWIDGQHLVRKSLVTESGKSVTEVITTTITSINKPVNITIPSASQTSPMPSSALSGSGI
jgi:hypothetical protein